MSATSNKRIEQIDIARGIAAICMILGHSFIVHPIDISAVGWCNALHIWIYSFHMELFFFLTGAVWHRTKILNYAKKKAMRILIPYVTFGVCSIVIRSLNIGAVNNQESAREGLFNLILHGGGYWFLYVLLFMYILYPIMDYVLLKMKSADEWILVLALSLMILSNIIKFPTVFMLDSLVYYFPFFLLGKYLLGTRKFLSNQRTMTIVIEEIIGVAAYALLSVVYSSFELLAMQQARAFIMIFVIYCFVEVIVRVKVKKERILSSLTNFVSDCGRYTLQLYLFNGYLLVIIRTVLVSIMKVYTPVVIVMAITVGNLVITLCLCKRILPKIPVVRTLCGL